MKALRSRRCLFQGLIYRTVDLGLFAEAQALNWCLEGMESLLGKVVGLLLGRKQSWSVYAAHEARDMSNG